MFLIKQYIAAVYQRFHPKYLPSSISNL